MPQKKPRRRRSRFTARTADKHVLYQLAVQAPVEDAAYMDRLFRRFRGRPAEVLKEDFCGTAILSCEWVKRSPRHQVIGVDLHGPTLDWSRKHNIASLTDDQKSRIQLIQDNVLNVTSPRVDLTCALNFSYFLFTTRDLMRKYFTQARAGLKDDGLFLLDAYGGSEALLEVTERRKCPGFTYVWEHASFNPLTHDTVCHIHFEFPDGTKMRKAFTYEWRLWSLVELRELLAEAGFRHTEVHWEGTDRDTGEGNGIYRKTTRGEAIESWVAYIIAIP